MLYSYRKISGHSNNNNNQKTSGHTVPQALERAGKEMKGANIIIHSVTHHILCTLLDSYKTTPAAPQRSQ